MWAIRILTGPQAGKTFILKPGSNSIGRSPDCDIRLDSRGVSKKHAEIYAFEDKVILSDAGSANGCFVNGIRIKSQQVSSGDKLVLHDVVISVVHSRVSAQAVGQSSANYTSAAKTPLQSVPNEPLENPKSSSPEDFISKAQGYFDDVVMPGVYKLVEIAEYKTILLIFLLAFIVTVTSLQVLPMISNMKSSLQAVSQRRAITIAKNLKAVNEQALRLANDSLLDVIGTEKEEGVVEALIVSADGRIKAPPQKAGGFSTRPFVAEATKKDRYFVKQISDTLIGASEPITVLNQESSALSTVAYAIVIYNIGNRAVDTGTTVNIFVINLLIALIVGFFLFIFIFKITEFPFISLNRQLDRALKDGTASIQIPFQFDVVQKLVSNINSALSRAAMPNNANANSILVDRTREATNLIDIFPGAAIAINGSNETIIQINEQFEKLTSSSALSLQRQPLSAINDSALRQSIEDLIQQFKANYNNIASNTLDFSGQSYQLNLHGIMDGRDIAYYIVSFKPPGAY